jgi:hypothetical protein
MWETLKHDASCEFSRAKQKNQITEKTKKTGKKKLIKPNKKKTELTD